MNPPASRTERAPARFGFLEFGIAMGIIALVFAAWYVHEAKRFDVAVRKAQSHEMRTFMFCVESAVADRKARTGVVRFTDVDGVVREWLRKGTDDFQLEPEWLAMWNAKRDVWGRALRFERTPLRGDSERLVIRSAGLDGVFGGSASDDVVARLLLSGEPRGH